MKLVVDANVLFSALIKHGTTAEIFVDERLEFFAPETLLEEFEKYKIFLVEKSGNTEKQFERVFKVFMDRITLLPKNILKPHMHKALVVCPDQKDADYFAAALHLKCSIWSNDKMLKQQDKIAIYTTGKLHRLVHP